MSPTHLRAFDQRHDGTLLGEGAAMLVLQREPWSGHCYAALRGAGSANDAASLTAPDTNAIGARLAIERCLKASCLEPRDIGIINAHGSGTRLNDATEAEAFRRLFGNCPEKPVVWGTKGNFGHSLGATGAIEAVATILALRQGYVPPILRLVEPDPDFPLPFSMGQGRATDARFGLSLTLGFGGFDTSLIFERVATS